MPEIERLLWNFLFAATSSAAADAGRMPPAEAQEISIHAVRELADILVKERTAA
ncbi:hypothetical protein [Hyphomicrobium sp.]|uniref:hypothetical protein n=1 Tax=Hyphomicrobium sp. TaxID=82 RepID=UPI002E2F7367|nr:hypothetical protein [Hyphomicrobium sp.]HEX2842521.1 hypothetical protein [Hyphomicrobium sp.]